MRSLVGFATAPNPLSPPDLHVEYRSSRGMIDALRKTARWLHSLRADNARALAFRFEKTALRGAKRELADDSEVGELLESLALFLQSSFRPVVPTALGQSAKLAPATKHGLSRQREEERREAAGIGRGPNRKKVRSPEVRVARGPKLNPRGIGQTRKAGSHKSAK